MGRIALSPQATQEAEMQRQAAMQERAAKNQATFASKQIRINTACAILDKAYAIPRGMGSDEKAYIVRVDVLKKANDLLLASLDPDFYTEGIE
jgi:hypothetical protein